MESSGVAGVYVSLVAAGGESKCVCSPGSLSLGHCSIRPNWVKRGRDGWRGGRGRTRMRHGPRVCQEIVRAKIRRKAGKKMKEKEIDANKKHKY